MPIVSEHNLKFIACKNVWYGCKISRSPSTAPQQTCTVQMESWHCFLASKQLLEHCLVLELNPTWGKLWCINVEGLAQKLLQTLRKVHGHDNEGLNYNRLWLKRMPQIRSRLCRPLRGDVHMQRLLHPSLVDTYLFGSDKMLYMHDHRNWKTSRPEAELGPCQRQHLVTTTLTYHTLHNNTTYSTSIDFSAGHIPDHPSLRLPREEQSKH